MKSTFTFREIITSVTSKPTNYTSDSDYLKQQEQQRIAVGTRKSAFHFWSPGGVRRRHADADAVSQQ